MGVSIKYFMGLVSSLIRLATWGLIVCEFASCAWSGVIRLDGFSDYEAYSLNGTRRLLVHERFSAFVEGPKWFIATELLATDPPGPAQLAFPSYQELGCDGGDIYEVKTLPKGTNLVRNGFVETGPVPNMFLSAPACIVWLAYCSGSQLPVSGPGQLKPVIWGALDTRSKQETCVMAVTFERNHGKPEFLDFLGYLCDGRQDPCNPSREPANMKTYPWRNGYTQAVFRVESPIAGPDGSAFPGTFKFDTFTESYGADFVPGDSATTSKGTTTLRLFTEVRAMVTNISFVDERASWLPDTEGKIGVRDYRFAATVTNWNEVAYGISNNWRTRTDAVVLEFVHDAERTKPVKKPVQLKYFTLIRIVLVSILAIATGVIAVLYLKRHTKKTKG